MLACADSRRGFALLYGALFGLSGTELPFVPVWLRAIGIDRGWIGIINAVPAVTQFTTLPFVTSLAERRHSVRGALIATAVISTVGFAVLGTQHETIAVFLVFVATACAWTPMVPLTDAYSLRGVVRFGIIYGPVRLWSSAAFILGAVACGLLIDVIDPRQLIWIIVAVAGFCALTSLALVPLDTPEQFVATSPHDHRFLRDVGFRASILASALIQGSHAAYYAFSATTWQAHRLRLLPS